MGENVTGAARGRRRRWLLALPVVLVAAGAAAWVLTRPPAPEELASRALAAYPDRDAVVHQVLETTGWTDYNDGFGFEIESWERPADGVRRTRWVDEGLARSDESVVDGELVADRQGARRIWYRSKDGTFVGEWRLKGSADRREALALAPETLDVIAELRAALRTGLTADNALEEFAGKRRRRITRERRIGGQRVRDSWFIDEDSASIIGLRRARWPAPAGADVRLEDLQEFRLVRYEQLAPTAPARATLTFMGPRSPSRTAGE